MHSTQESPEQQSSWKLYLLSFSKYVSVAGGSALVDWLVFLFLGTVGVSPLFAQMSARVFGGLFSFLCNKFWSFSSHDKRCAVIEMRRFLLLYAASYTVSIVLFSLFSQVFGISVYISKLTTDILIFVFNFFVMRQYVFRRIRGVKVRIFKRGDRT